MYLCTYVLKIIMHFKLETPQHQTTAIQSVVDVFEGMERNTFNTTQWSQMETAGAILLPAAGYLDGTTVGEYGGQGDYWSSTTDDGEKAKRLEFKNTEVTTANGINRSYGCSVRLVTTVNPAR